MLLKHLAILAVSGGLAFFSGPACAVGKVIYVSVGGSGDGSSWTDAYGSLQDALDDANSGDQIWVAEGTYTPTLDYGLGLGDRGRHFRMKNQVEIYGGFDFGDTELSQRRWIANRTILSGD